MFDASFCFQITPFFKDINDLGVKAELNLNTTGTGIHIHTNDNDDHCINDDTDDKTDDDDTDDSYQLISIIMIFIIF